MPGERLVQRLPIGEAEGCLRQLEEHITTVDVLGIDEDLQAAIKASAEAVPSEWSCAACTLLNPEPLVECAACGGRERAARPPTADASARGHRKDEIRRKLDLSVKLRPSCSVSAIEKASSAAAGRRYALSGMGGRTASAARLPRLAPPPPPLRQ